MANIQPIFDGESALSVLNKINAAIVEANLVDELPQLRVATSANIADAATYTVDFMNQVLHTLNIAANATTLTLAVSNLSITERANTIIFDNSANTSDVAIAFDDQSGAISFRRSLNEFPGVYPSMNVVAGTIWEVNFYSESATAVFVDFNQVED